MRSRRPWPAIAVLAAVLVGACSSSTPVASSPASPAHASADPTTDKLAQVEARGTLVLWTDPDYAPQSMAVKGAARLAWTKSAPNQMKAHEIYGNH